MKRAHHRPVLEHEQRAERREAEEEHQRLQAGDALRDPAQQRRADLGRGLLHALLGALRVVHAEVAQPALDLVQRLVRLRRDVARLGGDAAEDEQEDEHADGDEPEQHEDRAADARNPVALQPADRGSGDRAEHRGDDDRHDDRRRLGEQPDEPDDDQHEADQQPRREAEVPEPRRSRKLNVAFGHHGWRSSEAAARASSRDEILPPVAVLDRAILGGQRCAQRPAGWLVTLTPSRHGSSRSSAASTS